MPSLKTLLSLFHCAHPSLFWPGKKGEPVAVEKRAATKTGREHTPLPSSADRAPTERTSRLQLLNNRIMNLNDYTSLTLLLTIAGHAFGLPALIYLAAVSAALMLISTYKEIKLAKAKQPLRAKQLFRRYAFPAAVFIYYMAALYYVRL